MLTKRPTKSPNKSLALKQNKTASGGGFCLLTTVWSLTLVGVGSQRVGVRWETEVATQLLGSILKDTGFGREKAAVRRAMVVTGGEKCRGQEAVVSFQELAFL